MRTFLIILGGFFLTMFFLGAAGALDFRVCISEVGICNPKQHSPKSEG